MEALKCFRQPWVPAFNLTTVQVISNPLQAHTGNNFMEIGNFSGGSSSSQEGALQIASVPTNTLLLRFSYFWGCSIGTDPAGADAMSSFIQPDGATFNYLSPHLSANGGYFFDSFDFTNGYAGLSLQVRFYRR